MRQGGEPQGVQEVVRQGEPTPHRCDFNPLYLPAGLCRSRQGVESGGQVLVMWESDPFVAFRIGENGA